MRRSARDRRGAAALVVAAALLAGCGSTVQGTSVPVSSGDGLGASGVTSAASGLGGPTTGGLSGPVGTSPGPGANTGSSAVLPGSISSSSSSGGTTPGAQQGAGPAGPVTATGRIQLGFIVTNASNAGSFGISSGQTFSDQELYNALVAAMNKRGGIDGRKIDPVYGVTDTAAPNWSTQFQAACAKFTQDNHVAAVVGYIFVFMDSFESCLARAGVPHLYGGYQPGDVEQQRKYPTLVGTTAPTSDIHWQIGLGGAIATGRLTSKNKLGVIVDGCANDDKAFNRVGLEIPRNRGGMSYEV